MNEVIKNMLERRSIRKFKPEQISRKDLDIILEAGLYAPCAGGRQGVIIVACQNRAINAELGKINHSFFHGRMSTAAAYISKEQPSIADDPKITDGLYGAPTVITLFGARNFLYATPDCSVAAENIMLAAHSLGIGSCMIMRTEDTFDSDFGKRLQKTWGIDESYQAKAFVILGYSATEPPKTKPRKENRVKVVE
ncbi:nitroreductase family protein [Lacrimispora sp.]|uniref:nitroreductase family protein n=1 Tax=Lacrimispora sp. TaxID=2719234 RepID=UPI003461371A